MTKKQTETKKDGMQSSKKLQDKLSKVLTTDKQKSFLRNRLAGMNKRQSAIEAGYAPSTASIMAKRLTDRLACNQVFLEEMERQGLTIEAIVGEIKRGISDAMHPQHPDQPDNYNRRGYTDMALKIHGAYAPTKLDMTVDSREMTIEITPELVKRMEECRRIEAEVEAEERDV